MSLPPPGKQILRVSSSANSSDFSTGYQAPLPPQSPNPNSHRRYPSSDLRVTDPTQGTSRSRSASPRSRYRMPDGSSRLPFTSNTTLPLHNGPPTSNSSARHTPTSSGEFSALSELQPPPRIRTDRAASSRPPSRGSSTGQSRPSSPGPPPPLGAVVTPATPPAEKKLHKKKTGFLRRLRGNSAVGESDEHGESGIRDFAWTIGGPNGRQAYDTTKLTNSRVVFDVIGHVTA